MSFRAWVSLITFLLIAMVIYLAWPEMVKAFSLADKIDFWVLGLLIPIQFLSYYASGGMIFSYLRAKGNLKTTTHWQMTRIALELNFVNHVLPSGGVAGFSYLGWVLNRHGVSAGRATMSQIVRFAITFLSFIAMMIIAIVVLIFDHKINRPALIVCAVMIVFVLSGVAFMVHTISRHDRLIKFSGWLTRTANKLIKFFTRGKKHNVVKIDKIEQFFIEIHHDYLEIMKDKRILIKPLIWAIVENLTNVLMISVAFMALGAWVNPATLFVAFGLSSCAGAVSSLPGGAGVYETIMISFLASSGVPAEIAIAGTLLARVTLVSGAIIFGYFFYQLTINKYGKPKAKLPADI